MMPPVLFFLVLFGFIAFVIKMAMDHEKWKMQYKKEEGRKGESLTSGELKALIRSAVEEANATLLKRIERLEERSGVEEPLDLLDEADPEKWEDPASDESSLRDQARRRGLDF